MTYDGGSSEICGESWIKKEKRRITRAALFLLQRRLHHHPRLGIQRHVLGLAVERVTENLVLLIEFHDMNVLDRHRLRRYIAAPWTITATTRSPATATPVSRLRCFQRCDVKFNRHPIEARNLGLIQRYLEVFGG